MHYVTCINASCHIYKRVMTHVRRRARSSTLSATERISSANHWRVSRKRGKSCGVAVRRECG